MIMEITEYQEAHNNHDIEKELSFLAVDITFEAVNVWTKRGKDQIRKLAE